MSYLSVHSDGAALIRPDAVTNAAQPDASSQLGRRLKREERGTQGTMEEKRGDKMKDSGYLSEIDRG